MALQKLFKELFYWMYVYVGIRFSPFNFSQKSIPGIGETPEIRRIFPSSYNLISRVAQLQFWTSRDHHQSHDWARNNHPLF